jgi:hypothetical protein
MYTHESPEKVFEWWLKNKDTDLNDIDMMSLGATIRLFYHLNDSLHNHLSRRCKHTNIKKPFDFKEVCLDCGAVRLMSRYEKGDAYDFSREVIEEWSDWEYGF